MVNALVATDVNRGYGKLSVLRDFSLTVAAGEFAALMGPSGSGKSTFLHVAAGLLKADSGSIAIGGEEVAKLGDNAATRFRRRHIGFVFQSFNLVDSMSVLDNVTLPMRLDHGRPDKARARALLERLGIGAAAQRRRPDELSGGERQRVAIARALFRKPELILADEPTGNLDVDSAKEICRLLRELNREEGSAVLLVTHDPVVAAAAEKVHFLRDGRIAASCGTEHDPAAVSAHYLETYK